MKRETIFAFNIVMGLVLIGLLMVYSASAVRTYSAGSVGHPAGIPLLWKQLIYIGIGMACLIVMARFDYHHLRNRALLWPLFLVTLAVLVAVLYLGDERRGGQRWIEVLGFTFQPSELGKMTLVIFLAAKLSENQQYMHRFWRGFVPPLLLTGLVAGLVLLERDLGTPVVMMAVAMLMIVMAGGRFAHVLPTCLPAAVVVYKLIEGSGYRSERIDAWLDPWKYRSDKGLQLIESLAGFARGGFWGQGLGAGEQKLRYLPDAHSDFIFAVWAEEMGLLGSLGLVALFLLFLIVAVRIAVCARDLFGAILASGIVALIGIQACFNMAVTTGLLPTKGLALPFISAGGSALIVNLTLVGILLNIGAQAVELEEAPPLAVAK
ncbi:MAG: putative lipid II flippase FtsW [Candidatus Hydrogenedentes bacterium]|nr:putative lipid II flippase FtsW [Candidatus Hydrogenedentota bacterium]